MEAETLWWEVVPIAVALWLYGVLSGTEVALLTAQKSRLLQWKENGRRGAATAYLVYETLEPCLMTVRLSLVFVGVLAAMLAGAFAVREVAPWLMTWRLFANLGGWNITLALACVLFTLTYIILVFGQLLPRAVAQQHPESFLCWVARPFVILVRFCGGLRMILTVSSQAVLWLFGQQLPLESPPPIHVITEEDLTSLVREGAERGIFEKVEHELIAGVFEFTDTATREIMVPRVHIQALEVTTSPQEAIHKLIEIGHTRVPVYRGDLDHIVGVLALKDVLRAIGEGTPWEVESLLHPPLYVPETVQISSLLRTLQQRHLNMAIVVDEHGGVAGLVTIEDLLEQLVGDIRDEDEPQTEALVTQLSDGSLVVQGSVPLWELRENYALPVAESADYQTVAGLLLARLGLIPKGGESIVEQGCTFTVVDMDGPRIARVKIEQPIAIESVELSPESLPVDEERRGQSESS